MSKLARLAASLLTSTLEHAAHDMVVNSPGASDASVQPTDAALSQARVQKRRAMVYAHGVIMAFTFAVFFPLGAAVIGFKGRWNILWLHVIWQLSFFAATVAGLGLGIWVAQEKDMVCAKERLQQSSHDRAAEGIYQWGDNFGHPIIGLFVTGALLVMPITGFAYVLMRAPRSWLHSHPSSPSIFSRWIHVWWGRLIVLLGIINGGLGIRLAGVTMHWLVSYCVVAGIFSLIWLASIVHNSRMANKQAVERAGRSDIEMDEEEPRQQSAAEQSFRTDTTAIAAEENGMKEFSANEQDPAVSNFQIAQTSTARQQR